MADIGSIVGGFTSGFRGLGSIAMYVLYFLLFAAVAWAAWYITSFNVKVLVRQRAGESNLIIKDAGRFVKDKNNPGVEFFQLMKNKRRWNFPLDRSYVELERKAFGRIGRVVFFAEDAQGRLQPVKPVHPEDLFKWSGWTLDGMEYVTRGVKETIERHKSGDFWAKYGGLVQMGAYLVMFLILIFLFRELDGVVSGLKDVAAAMNTASQAFQVASLSNSTQVIVG